RTMRPASGIIHSRCHGPGRPAPRPASYIAFTSWRCEPTRAEGPRSMAGHASAPGPRSVPVRLEHGAPHGAPCSFPPSVSAAVLRAGVAGVAVDRREDPERAGARGDELRGVALAPVAASRVALLLLRRRGIAAAPGK